MDKKSVKNTHFKYDGFTRLFKCYDPRGNEFYREINVAYREAAGELQEESNPKW